MRPNNFDLARLILASMVVLFHCAALSGSPALHVLRSVDRHAAVEGFFVISGFLIVASYERSRSLSDYAQKRAARILPGYWVSIALCVSIVFAFTHRLHVSKFLASSLLFLNFLQPGVPGVFESNPADAALNGSLWTIKIEVMFYVCVPLLVWLCRKVGKLPVLLACALLSTAYRHWMLRNSALAVQLPGQLSFFCMGALGYYYLPQFRRWGKYLVVPAALVYVFQTHLKWFFLRPLCIPVLVLAFCFLLPEIKGPTKWGDFSYGVYVLHYPIVQTLVALGVFAASPATAVALTLALVAAAAVLSWHYVEKPWLMRTHAAAETRRAFVQAAGSN